MIKKIIISACLLLSLMSFAQGGSSSPYSFYGIGEVRFKGSLENRSMGGLSVAPDSIHINLENPAGYANLKLTTFTMGGSRSSTKLKTDTESAKAQRTTLDYLALALPFGKFGVGLGLIPYSSVGYKVESISTDGSQNNYRFNGSGGVNKVFLGMGYEIAPNLSIGADAHYNFGRIETYSLEFVPYVSIGSRELNTADLSGVNFNIGMMYQAKINKKLSFFSSLNFSPESTLTSENTRNISTVIFNSNYDVQVVDELENLSIPTNLKMPSKLSLGAGIGDSGKWLLGAEFTSQNKGNLTNSYNTIDNVVYGKYSKYSIGGYYVPNSKSFSSYTKRITYRGGFKYEKTGLIINSQPINDVGLTLGLGLPITGSFSNVNFGLEVGKKGTKAANLIQENYINLNVSFSLNDKWFVKTKFN
ncbi:MAG: hypothetical protein PHC28_05115 [Flavobacterium sp.]|uniref:hypothetical protein n=1 Tax=Flavobacterium sp. TaxID=239 RepID=UPI002603710C|nr:hypothetical protein [Flavobacterium sp.]MDD5149847.1 hypothetical protein [Flavobacterium sp.]